VRLTVVRAEACSGIPFWLDKRLVAVPGCTLLLDSVVPVVPVEAWGLCVVVCVPDPVVVDKAIHIIVKQYGVGCTIEMYA